MADTVARALAISSPIDLERAVDGFVYPQRVFANKFFVWLRQPGGRWVRYDVRHFENEEINLHAWRVYTAEILDIADTSPEIGTTESNVLTIMQAGSNWEYAIRIKDSGDFFGGQHGDEIMQDTMFIADGKPVAYDSLATVRKRNQFEMVQHSIVYDPTDGATKAGDMYCRWIWSGSGLEIKWELVWSDSFTVDLAYGAMMPVVRGSSTSTKCRYMSRATEHDIGSSGHALPGLDTYGIELYNTSNNLSCAVEIDPEWFNEYAKSNGQGIWVYDGDSYNKVYPTRVTSGETEDVSAAEVWQLSARYRISFPK